MKPPHVEKNTVEPLARKDSVMKRFVGVFTLLVAVAVIASTLVACTPVLPTTPAGIDGTVESVVPGDGRPLQFMVSGGTQQAGSVSDKAQVGMNPATQFFGPDGKPGDPATIVVGARVKVWFTGPVAESYPVQGTAKVVQILAR